MSIALRLTAAITTFKSNVAFCINEKKFTYNLLGERIVSIIEALDKTENSSVVGVVSNDELDTYAAIFACWLSGRTYVPLNVNFPNERNNYIVETAQIKTVLNSKSATLPFDVDSKVNVINTEDCINGEIGKLKSNVVNRNDDAYILFTSGSTGSPKGVPISYANLNAFIDGFDMLGYNISEQDKCLQMYELSFDISVVAFLQPILHGASVYTTNNEDVKYMQVLKLVAKHQLSVIHIVPSIVKLLKPLMDRINNESLRLCILAGEATDVDMLIGFSKAFSNVVIYNMYGPTEATIYCTYYKYIGSQTKNYHNMFAIGKPMKYVKLILVDENNAVVEEYLSKGELCVAGGHVTRGYINNEERNKTSFIDIGGTTFYKTGDMCFRDEEGDYFYCGRYDNQVKILGYRIELHEIEHIASKISNLNNVVIPIDSEQNSSILELVLVVESAVHIDEHHLYSEMSTYLPSYMIPNRMVCMESFPINNSGKTDRKKIKEHLLNVFNEA